MLDLQRRLLALGFLGLALKREAIVFIGCPRRELAEWSVGSSLLATTRAQPRSLEALIPVQCRPAHCGRW